MAIYIKDNVSRKTLIKLIEYSLCPECQFRYEVIPGQYHTTSVVRFLKVEEKQGVIDGRKYRQNISVKVCVEDTYTDRVEVPPDDRKVDCVKAVPPSVLNKVCEILNGGE